jgi:hypothetical protein
LKGDQGDNKFSMIKTIALSFLLVGAAFADALGQAREGIQAGGIPRIVEKDGRHALLVDGRPFLVLGGQAHNSSGWPAMLPQVWAAVVELHANTLEIPIYWEQVEPRQGMFDFSMIHDLLVQARENKVHLILLWFATWKNGSNHYVPEWMKRDAVKYPNITDRSGRQADSPSPHSKAAMEADSKAFAAVMRYLKQADGLHTVIMVQIENEPGSWGSLRDYSAQAQELFDGSVPAELLQPDVLRSLHVPIVGQGGWQAVFGDRADEYFQAWSIARYIGQIAAAGKAAYPLPLYVNAALRDPLTDPPATNYESGGATDNVLPIWKVAAPAVDILAPDIYLSGSERVLKVIELYDRPNNGLFVPEAGLIPENAKYLYAVIAHDGIGYSPFGIDDNGLGETNIELAERLSAFSREYGLAEPMMRDLAKWAFEGRIKAVVEHEDHGKQTIDLGAWQATVSFGMGRADALRPNEKPSGKAMIVRLDDNKFVLIGTSCHISFGPAGNNSGRAWQFLKVEEGQYETGIFHPRRILNGDETDWGGPGFGVAGRVLQAELILR